MDIAYCLLLIDIYIKDCGQNADKMRMVVGAESITFAAVLGIF